MLENKYKQMIKIRSSKVRKMSKIAMKKVPKNVDFLLYKTIKKFFQNKFNSKKIPKVKKIKENRRKNKYSISFT